MTKKLSSAIAIAAILSSASLRALAQESTTSSSGETAIKVENLETEKENKTEDKADQIITNKKMRAETGSLSKFSLSTEWNYSAGSIEKPLDPVRPNITGAAGTPALQRLGGTVNLKYRVSTTQYATLGVGLAMTTPFHTSISTNDPKIQKQFDRNRQRLDVNDPTVGYNWLARVAGLQSVSSLGATYITTNLLRDWGYQSGLGLSQVFAKDLTPVTLGVSLNASYSFFDQAANKPFGGPGETLGSYQSDVSLGVYPFAEYAVSDTFTLRTLAGVASFDRYRGEMPWTFSQNTMYMSVGLGISVNRDVYIYPNVQFLPENIRSDLTNVAINANINVF